MVAKTKTKGEDLRTRRLKLGKLKLNKETVKDLTGTEQNQLKGGVGPNTEALPRLPDPRNTKPIY